MLLRPDKCYHGDGDYNEGDDGDDEGNDGDDDYNEGVDGDDGDNQGAHQDDWADKRVGEEADRVTEWRGHLFNYPKFLNHWILEILD